MATSGDFNLAIAAAENAEMRDAKPRIRLLEQEERRSCAVPSVCGRRATRTPSRRSSEQPESELSLLRLTICVGVGTLRWVLH